MATKKAKKSASKFKKAVKDTPRMIRNAIQKVQKKGLQISYAYWGIEMDADKGYFVTEDPKGSVCALGALLVHKNGSVEYSKLGIKDLTHIKETTAAAFVLGVDEVWVHCFVAGFDGTFDGDSENKSEFHSKAGPVVHNNPTYQDLLDATWDDEWSTITFRPSKKPKVLEMRRAYNMGRNFRQEFVS